MLCKSSGTELVWAWVFWVTLCLCHLGEMVGAVREHPTVDHSGAGLVGWLGLA